MTRPKYSPFINPVQEIVANFRKENDTGEGTQEGPIVFRNALKQIVRSAISDRLRFLRGTPNPVEICANLYFVSFSAL